MHLSTRHGDRLGRAEALRIGAQLDLAAGAQEAARGKLLEALTAYRELGARSLEAEAHADLGRVLAELGRVDEARGRIEAALVLERELGNRYAEAELLGSLGEMALEAGYAEEAAALLEQAAGRSREIGACDLEGRFLAALALPTGAARADRAAFLIQQAEQLVRGEGGGEQLVVVLCRRAELEAASGDRERALATLREIEARHGQLDAPASARLRRLLDRTRARSGA
jgi:tetratricopeptide (TPR) repeat protein